MLTAAIAQRIADAERDAAPSPEAITAARCSHDPSAALSLYSLMSDLSERHYCAGWMAGIEDELWTALGSASHRVGTSALDEVDVATLAHLSERCDGWWSWGDDELRFVTAGEWRTQRSH